MFPKVESVIKRIETLLDRVEQYLPARNDATDWKHFIAYRWRREQTIFGRRGALVGVAHPHIIRFSDLKDIDEQKSRLETNTRQFVMGRPANKEGVGISDFGIIVIDTDGTVTKNDTLKVAHQGADRFSGPQSLHERSLLDIVRGWEFEE